MQHREIRPNDAKLRELILLVAEYCQKDPRFGAIKLNKLLFHADFCAFLTHGEPITGQQYFALKQGPAPRRLKPITESMKKKGELAYQDVLYFGRLQKRPVALRSPNVSLFSGVEINLVRQTVERFWDLTATEISDQSHLFLGWKVARLGETIPYNTALVSRRLPTPEERTYGLSLKGLATEHLRVHG